MCCSLVQLLPCHFYHAFFAIYRGYWFGLSCTWWSFYQCYITNFLMNVFVDKSIVRFIIYLYWITMNLLVVNHSRSRIIYFCESDANKSFHSLLDGIHYKGQTWYAYFECCFVFSFFVNFSLVECRIVLHAHRLGKLLLFTWLYE